MILNIICITLVVTGIIFFIGGAVGIVGFLTSTDACRKKGA